MVNFDFTLNFLTFHTAQVNSSRHLTFFCSSISLLTSNLDLPLYQSIRLLLVNVFFVLTERVAILDRFVKIVQRVCRITENGGDMLKYTDQCVEKKQGLLDYL